MKRASPFALAVLLALAACGGDTANNELAAIDNELIANSVDPALTMALQDQLSVDPTLAQQTPIPARTAPAPAAPAAPRRRPRRRPAAGASTMATHGRTGCRRNFRPIRAAA